MGRAGSRYLGLRVTITQAPESESAWVTVSTKDAAGRWDEWTLLFPAMRIDAGRPAGVDEVLDLLRCTLDGVANEL